MPREKKCGHMGGKVLVPTQQAIRNLVAARLAADVMGVPTILIARTDANAAKLLTSDVDPRDRPFLTGERTPEGFFRVRARPAIRPSPAAWPTLLTPTCSGAKPPSPIWRKPRSFAEAIHEQVSGQTAGLQLLAVIQLEEEAGRCHHRRASSTSLAKWATSSSSSPWPASMP